MWSRIAIVVSILVSALAAHAAASTRPLVILVSIDGFRVNYLQRGLTPALSGLAEEGVRSTGMQPAFPSVTFPNHYTLVTGLTPDHHGVVANAMIDPAIQPDSRFAPGDFTAVSDARWWNEGEPIWVTAKKARLRTGLMFWPGSEAPIRGVRPDLWAHFDASITPDQRVDVVLDWLDLPQAKRPDFITLYFDQVDHAGHLYGPDSPQVNAALKEVDAAVGRLVEGLRRRGLMPASDLVIVADHGMAPASTAREVLLDDFIAPDEADVITTGAVAELTPSPGEDVSRLLAARDHMRCWRKADLPPRFHYGVNPRIPPIVCVAEVGWCIDTRAHAARRTEPLGGEHGYDPASPEMAALFLAEGPDFRRGAVIAPFDNVDVEPLLAHLLRIEAPAGDGSLAPLRPALASP